MKSLADMILETDKHRVASAERWKEHDHDLCMLCHAYGEDKRSLFISCFYNITEVLPEAIDLTNCPDDVKGRGFYLRICKSCRAKLLGMLKDWGESRIALRLSSKGSDGDIYDGDETRNIPVRINGVVAMMNEREYNDYKKKQEADNE